VSINTTRVDKKASTINHAKFSLVGNNSTGHNILTCYYYHLLVITTNRFICQFEYTLCSSSVATLEVHQVHDEVLRP
jgi:hypothetical protein